MPTISMFLGIVIRMNWLEHNPPHFHAEYQGTGQCSIWMEISLTEKCL